MADVIWTWIAALLTLCVFSFMYKDNPLYKFAEHLMVGVTGGYLICLAWFEVIRPQVVNPIMKDPAAWFAGLQFIPVIMMLLMLARLGEKTAWLARFPLAFIVGFSAGVQIPQVIDAEVLKQVQSTVQVGFDGGIAQVAGDLLLVVGTICALMYFFFSMPRKRVLKWTSQFGVLVLMAGFGASFGYTVMARISLLIGRVLFLMRDWLHVIS
ncbi:MAG: hypothetical protein GXP49_08210 [Deltaproteobacteria bacterium]|nr:hypothetical protein [Deltaproteobacteria bacterium]